MDRRSFLRSLQLAVVGVAIAPVLPSPVKDEPLFASGGAVAAKRVQVFGMVESELVRVENPDDAEQFVMVEHIKRISVKPHFEPIWVPKHA